ncbi:MAG: type II secretion system protein [Thermoanaerobaculia bacterium]
MAFCAWCGNHVTEVSYAACPRCGNPTNGSQRVAGGDGSKNAGIVVGIIAGGLVLLFIVGILAAIAIPNFLTALQRSRQKRSAADMRTIATALEAYATDKNLYPEATAVTELSSTLTPTYIKQVPAVDGWGTAYRYECWPAGDCKNYAITSAGADKTFEYESAEGYPADTKTSDFDDDIVLVNGRFAQYPEGAQQ